MPELSHSFVKREGHVVLRRSSLQTTCDNGDKAVTAKCNVSSYEKTNSTDSTYVFHRFYRFYVQLHAASSVAAANTLFSLLWVELFT